MRQRFLCYNCDKRFVPAHKCKTQPVFILETMIEPEIDEDTTEALKEAEPLPVLEISLHALSRVTTLLAMHVSGVTRGRLVHILIDSGSKDEAILGPGGAVPPTPPDFQKKKIVYI